MEGMEAWGEGGGAGCEASMMEGMEARGEGRGAGCEASMMEGGGGGRRQVAIHTDCQSTAPPPRRPTPRVCSYDYLPP